MNSHYIIHWKTNRLLNIEFFILAVVLGLIGKIAFAFHWTLSLWIAFLIFIIFKEALRRYRWFRYCFAIGFSFIWTSLSVSFVFHLNQNEVFTPWLVGLSAFVGSWYLHKNEFLLLKQR